MPQFFLVKTTVIPLLFEGNYHHTTDFYSISRYHTAQSGMPNVFPLNNNNVYQELPTTIVSHRVGEIRKNSADYGFRKVQDGSISGRVCRKQ